MSEGKVKDEFKSVRLCRDVKKGRVLEVLKSLPGDNFSLLTYTPDFCGFADWRDGRLSRLDGMGEIAPESVFELRCFCQDFEFRWVREPAEGTGNGVLVLETQSEGLEPDPREFLKRSGHYLLWGKGTSRSGGMRLFEHRVGELPLPAEVEETLKGGGRVWLTFDEYFSPDEYGNMVWRLERLKGLEVE